MRGNSCWVASIASEGTLTHGRLCVSLLINPRRSVATTRACTSICRSYKVDFSQSLSSSRAEARQRMSESSIVFPKNSIGSLSPPPALNTVFRFLAWKPRRDRDLQLLRDRESTSFHVPPGRVLESGVGFFHIRQKCIKDRVIALDADGVLNLPKEFFEPSASCQYVLAKISSDPDWELQTQTTGSSNISQMTDVAANSL